MKVDLDALEDCKPAFSLDEEVDVIAIAGHVRDRLVAELRAARAVVEAARRAVNDVLHTYGTTRVLLDCSHALEAYDATVQS